MRAEGFEPPRLAPPAPKAGMSTSFITPAREPSHAARAGLYGPPRMAEDDARIEHPNREKASSKASKAVVILLLLVSAALVLIVTIGGWDALAGRQARADRLHPHLPGDGVLRRALEPRRAAGGGGAGDHPAHLRRGRRAPRGSSATRPASTTRRSTRACSGSSRCSSSRSRPCSSSSRCRPSRRAGTSRSSAAPTARPGPRRLPAADVPSGARPGGGMADSRLSKSRVLTDVRVRIPPRACPIRR